MFVWVFNSLKNCVSFHKKNQTLTKNGKNKNTIDDELNTERSRSKHDQYRKETNKQEPETNNINGKRYLNQSPCYQDLNQMKKVAKYENLHHSSDSLKSPSSYWREKKFSPKNCDSQYRHKETLYRDNRYSHSLKS